MQARGASETRMHDGLPSRCRLHGWGMFELDEDPTCPMNEVFADDAPNPGKTGQGTDDRALALAVQALQESEARFHTALRAGRMGSWETDLVARTRTWSSEGMALFGLDLADGRGQVGGDADEYVNALHPADRHLAQKYHDLADQQDAFTAEYRIVRPEGRAVAVRPRPRGGAAAGRQSATAGQHHGRRDRAQAGRRDPPDRAGPACPGPAGRPDGRLRPEHQGRRALVVAADVLGIRRRTGKFHTHARVGGRAASSRRLAEFHEDPRGGNQAPPCVHARISHLPARWHDRVARSPGPGRIRRRRPAGAQFRRRVRRHPTQARRVGAARCGSDEGQLHRNACARIAQSARADSQRGQPAAPGRAPRYRRSSGAAK